MPDTLDEDFASFLNKQETQEEKEPEQPQVDPLFKAIIDSFPIGYKLVVQSLEVLIEKLKTASHLG